MEQLFQYWPALAILVAVAGPLLLRMETLYRGQIADLEKQVEDAWARFDQERKDHTNTREKASKELAENTRQLYGALELLGQLRTTVERRL